MNFLSILENTEVILYNKGGNELQMDKSISGGQKRKKKKRKKKIKQSKARE